MRELQAGPVDLDQAQLLGRRQGLRAWPGHGRGCRAQVRAVGHCGQQQRGLRRLGQRGEPGGQDGGQPVRQRQRLSGPPPAGPGIIGDHRGQLDQRHRITGRLREHLRPGLPTGRPRLPVQQQAGVPGGQRLQMQLGEAAVKTGGRGLPPGTHQQHHPLGVQPTAREGQRVQRTAVQPVRVIGDHQDRGPFRQIRQQRQDGHPGQQRVRRTGIRRNAQRPQQRLGLPPRQPGGNRQHRPQQLMQPGEREPGLRLPASDRQHPHPRGPRAPGSVGQQHGLAHPRLTRDQQHPAGPRDRIHQGAQPGQPSLPADHPSPPLGGQFTGTWHEPVLSGQYAHQHRLQAQQRPRPGHARSPQSAVTRPIPPRTCLQPQ